MGSDRLPPIVASGAVIAASAQVIFGRTIRSGALKTFAGTIVDTASAVAEFNRFPVTAESVEFVSHIGPASDAES
jgi:hypothetical protein